jgi:hypothetical protein
VTVLQATIAHSQSRSSISVREISRLSSTPSLSSRVCDCPRTSGYRHSFSTPETSAGVDESYGGEVDFKILHTVYSNSMVALSMTDSHRTSLYLVNIYFVSKGCYAVSDFLTSEFGSRRAVGFKSKGAFSFSKFAVLHGPTTCHIHIFTIHLLAN